MVILKEVKKINNIVTAWYYMLDENDLGYIEYDIKQKEIVSHQYNKEDARSAIKRGLSKAAEAIDLMAKHNKFPAKFEYSWY
jgi:hypothetical protein